MTSETTTIISVASAKPRFCSVDAASAPDDVTAVLTVVRSTRAVFGPGGVDALVQAASVQASASRAGPDVRELADEASRLNETCRIYVNLMAANTRRRLQTLTGDAFAAHRPMLRGAFA